MAHGWPITHQHKMRVFLGSWCGFRAFTVAAAKVRNYATTCGINPAPNLLVGKNPVHEFCSTSWNANGTCCSSLHEQLLGAQSEPMIGHGSSLLRGNRRFYKNWVDCRTLKSEQPNSECSELEGTIATLKALPLITLKSPDSNGVL